MPQHCPNHSQETNQGGDCITAVFHVWLTWKLPFPLAERDYYQRRGTLYVETQPGCGTYQAYKPVHCTAHGSDGFKHEQEIMQQDPLGGCDLISQEGVFGGVHDPCVCGD